MSPWLPKMTTDQGRRPRSVVIFGSQGDTTRPADQGISSYSIMIQLIENHKEVYFLNTCPARICKRWHASCIQSEIHSDKNTLIQLFRLKLRVLLILVMIDGMGVQCLDLVLYNPFSVPYNQSQAVLANRAIMFTANKALRSRHNTAEHASKTVDWRNET